MQDPDASITSITLLSRLRLDDEDPDAWRAFVDRYGRRIHDWCLNRGLQAADAEDVTQEVLVKLAKRLGSFEYDERLTFRGWLRRITENAVIDFHRERTAGSRVTAGLELLADAVARVDLARRIDEAFDLELFEIAQRRVRDRVAPRRWLAWHWTTIDGRPAAEVAARLRMKMPTVYSSRYQVQSLICAEVQRLERTAAAVFVRDETAHHD